MIYANAEITTAEYAREILAFADCWHADGSDRSQQAVND
jgi:hypothetical protein